MDQASKVWISKEHRSTGAMLGMKKWSACGRGSTPPLLLVDTPSASNKVRSHHEQVWNGRTRQSGRAEEAARAGMPNGARNQSQAEACSGTD